jgi:ABC-type glycerol-3-phosphate transport system permease component
MATEAQVTTSREVRTSFEESELQRLKRLGAMQWIGEIAKYVVLVVLGASFASPFFWMITSAIKDDNQVYTVPPVWFPKPAYWNNFWDAWTTLDFNLYTFNTVVRYALPVAVGTVLSSALVAYAFGRLEWPGRDILFSICLMTMMIPGWVRTVPLFVTFRKLGWINSFKPLVIPAYFGNAYFIFLLRQFFMDIPTELSDAARIDGAGEFAIFYRVILPLTKPALTVVALFSFMGAWNNYIGPLIYANVEELYTLALGIARLRGNVYEVGYSRLAYPYLMAVSALSTLPIVLAFFFAQRTFIEGISLTGLKE